MAAYIPKISQLTPRIIRILGCNPGPMTLQGTNTYLIGTGKRRVLLDVGEKGNTDYLSSLTSVLEEYDTTIDKVIITHWHRDHIGGLKDVLGCSRGDVKVYKFPRADAPEDSVFASVDHKFLTHKEEIKTEGGTLRVHHTPGHTTDHVVLELTEEGILFSGDCILGEGTTVFEDLSSYMASLKLILDIEPKVIYPGHGPVINDPNIHIEQYINHRKKREEQIIKLLTGKKHMTSMELVTIMYKDTPEHLHLAAKVNVDHHLQKLLKENIVCFERDRWCLIQRKNQL
ncbi:endoribonuclease LACTB2 isoform X1 [Panulirus ornatus]|uniref:endoribonuclease LACTB2 isoform X1 n=1 Tax=Panulirus ornatus TaxID=150431 RepID=UPI003A884655